MRASFILALILIACPFQSAQECNSVNQNLPCKNSSDCSTGKACFPQTMLKGNRTFQNSSCQPLDSPCQLTSNQSVPCSPSRSFICNSTQSGTCSECCVPGLAYRLYSCSAMQQEVNHAILLAVDVANLNSTCSTQTAYTNRDMVVSLATGWMAANRSGLCLTNINISAPNDRSVTAKVVTECKSSIGCTAESSFREPCAPDGVAATEAVWRALGYDPQVGRLERITWSVLAVEKSILIPRGSKKSSGARTIGIACGAIGLVATSLGVAGALFWRKRRKQQERTRREERELMEDMRLDMLPHHMRYHDLRKATGNFSPKVKLGEGGFGSVFKGTLGDGSLVAVKKMDLDIQGSTSGRLQFQAEVMSIGSIHHVNLVRLRGYCLHKAACLLVYEFMPNGSLDRWIFLDEKVLDWKLRHSIAVDVARGLTYLHEGCREQVLHLDIKPQNILLDENMRAKISDFGLAKLAERGKSNLVSGLRGTPGYMAPEWLGSSVSDKTDVYSYGMLLLQLITSRKAVQLSTSSQMVVLGEVADKLFHDGKIMELVDERLLGQNGLAVEAAYEYVKICLLCIQPEPVFRPTMSDVLKMLEGDREVMPKFEL